MDFAFELMDRIGARLSGSPNLDRAVSWAIERLTKAGLAKTLTHGKWTVFAPTDAAFAKVPKATLAKLGKDTIAAVYKETGFTP